MANLLNMGGSGFRVLKSVGKDFVLSSGVGVAIIPEISDRNKGDSTFCSSLCVGWVAILLNIGGSGF